LGPGDPIALLGCKGRTPANFIPLLGAARVFGRSGLVRRLRLLPFNRFVLVHHGCYIPSTSTFFRKATVLDEGHCLDKRFRVAMDGELYARLASHNKRFRYLPCVLADFRLHGQNQSMVTLHGGRCLETEYKSAIHAAEVETIVRT